MTPAELLDFLAPSLAATEPEKATALAIAESYRPACLSAAKQDEAQALYAAWLLTNREQQSEGVPAMGVISEKEGDLARTYGHGEAVLDPAGFYARFKRLADMCGHGAILAGRSDHGCCPRY